MKVLQKLTMKYGMFSPYRPDICTQRKPDQNATEELTPPCILQPFHSCLDSNPSIGVQMDIRNVYIHNGVLFCNKEK